MAGTVEMNSVAPEASLPVIFAKPIPVEVLIAPSRGVKTRR